MPKTLFDKQSDAIIQSGLIQAQAISNAASIQMQMARESIEFQKEQNQIARATLAPFVEAGQAGTEQLQNLLGINGVQAEQEAAQAVLQGPVVQESIQQGISALERSAASRGGLNSGRVAAALQQFGQSQALGAVQQRIGNLQQLGNQGVGAAGGSAQLAQQLGANVGNTLFQTGDRQSQFALMQGQVAAASNLATSPASELAFNLANAQANPGALMQAGGGGGSFGFLGGAQGRMGGFF